MTIVAWDGNTLATDRQGTNAGLRYSVSKLKRCVVDGKTYLLAICGGAAEGYAMLDWFEKGRVDPIPATQATEDWARLIVVSDDRVVTTYERTAFPLTVLEPYCAWGSGRDYALGALAMDADAIKAVKIACQFDISCGLGVDYMTVDGGTGSAAAPPLTYF